MRFNYSPGGNYPELNVPVVIGSINSPLVLDFDATIDTGADITVVPSRVRASFGIEVKSWATSSGALGQEWKRIPVFYVRIRVAGGDWIPVLATESDRNYVLLGRNIINQFLLTANGPAGWFELEAPA